MKKRIWILTMFLILLILFCISKSNTCYAAVDTEALEAYLNGGVSQQQINQSNNPKYAERNGSTEVIDPVTGNLSIKQTDIRLTGKDNLDLSIGRIYNSSQERFVKKCRFYEVNVGIQTVLGYSFSVTGYKNGVQEMQFSLFFDEYEYAVGSMNYWNNTTEDGWTYETTPIVPDIGTVQVTEGRIENYIDLYSYNITRYNLGAGWSLSFPSVQIEKENGRIFTYYHDGTGAVYRVIDTTDTGNSNLEGYPGNDVKFIKDNGSYINADNIPSKYKFINAELTTTYFAEDGRLLGIKDRFNNEIKFQHKQIQIYDKSFPLISKIVDSIGRIITFTYVDNNIELSITAPNEGNTLKFTYARYFLEDSFTYNGVRKVYKYPTLDYVEDVLGQKTYFVNYWYVNNSWPLEEFSFNGKGIAGGDTNNRYLLWGIVYPGSKTYYEYEKVVRNLGELGATSAYRVKSRHDENQSYNNSSKSWEWIKDNNQITYAYSGDFTGYPTYRDEDKLPDSYQFWNEVTSSNGLKTKTIFNGTKQIVQVENTANNNEKQVIKNISFDSNFKDLPTSKEFSVYDVNGALVRSYYQELTYTPWGGIATKTDTLTSSEFNTPAIKANHTTLYRYDNLSYKYFVTNKQWYQNSTVLLNETYSYDSLGRIESFINANGEITAYRYYTDSSNNKVEEESKQLENGKYAKVKKIYGLETGYAFPKELISNYTDSEGVLRETKTTYTYNLLLCQVESETNDANKTTSYTYDNLGRVTLIQKPDYTNLYGTSYGVEEVYSYVKGYNWDYSQGNYQGANGLTVNTHTIYTNKNTNIKAYYNQYSMLYDAYGNLLLQKSRTTGIIQKKYTYDNKQRVISYMDALGNTVSQSHGPWGQVNEFYDASGNLYVGESDLIQNKNISYFVAKDNILAYRANVKANTFKENYVEEYYDQYGRVIKRSMYANWPEKSGELSESFKYDYVGNLTGHTDPNQNLNIECVTTSYHYDKLNRIIQVRDALDQLTNVTYTVLGNIASIDLKSHVNAPAINIYKKSFDELGALRTKTDPAGASTNFSYNSLGFNISSSDRNGSIQTLTYDTLNQLQERLQVSSDKTESIGYKNSYTNPYGAIDIQLYNNGRFVNQEHYYYNNDGQVTQRNSLATYIKSNVSLQYDKAGRMTSIGTGVEESNYFYINYQYTGDRITKVQTDGQQANNTSDANNVVYEYYPIGNLKKITYPILNDNMLLTTEYYYNTLGRLISLINKKGNTVLSEYEYTYDANGNIHSIYDGKQTTNYEYDKLNRLIKITPQQGNSIAYSYNLKGDRIEESGSSFYDNFATTSYKFNVENTLKSVTKDTDTITIQYYADGMRAKKITASGYTSYIYDLSGNLVAEAKNSSTVTSNYVWGPDKVLAQKTNGQDYYYLYNGHGDVIQIVDRNGNVVNSYEYDEWGNIRTSNETISNPFKYAGEIYDEETGLYYLRARYYDPSLGRFINEDTNEGTIRNPLSLNAYTYCYNNPLKYVDPSGHIPVFIFYLGKTALETIPDIALDVLLDGDKFNLFKSCASNFMFNLIPGLGESKTGKKVIKVAAKYGDDVIQYLAKYGDEVAKYIGKNGKSGLLDFIVKRSDEVAQGASKTADNVWDMTKGGKSINGRWYSEHSLERMAPDTPQVRAELEARAIQKGLQPGTKAFNSYVDPRGIPSSVVEDAIQNGTRTAGNTTGTWVYESGDVRVITNNNGGVVTVIPK